MRVESLKSTRTFNTIPIMKKMPMLKYARTCLQYVSSILMTFLSALIWRARHCTPNCVFWAGVLISSERESLKSTYLVGVLLSPKYVLNSIGYVSVIKTFVNNSNFIIVNHATHKYRRRINKNRILQLNRCYLNIQFIKSINNSNLVILKCTFNTKHE